MSKNASSDGGGTGYVWAVLVCAMLGLVAVEKLWPDVMNAKWNLNAVRIDTLQAEVASLRALHAEPAQVEDSP